MENMLRTSYQPYTARKAFSRLANAVREASAQYSHRPTMARGISLGYWEICEENLAASVSAGSEHYVSGNILPAHEVPRLLRTVRRCLARCNKNAH